MLSPATILLFLVVALIALIPVWRLRAAGWPARWLATTWIVLTAAVFLAVRFPGPFRFMLPILVLAFLVPFVAGPERLARVLGGRRPQPGVIIDVTPRVRVDRPVDDAGTDDRRDAAADVPPEASTDEDGEDRRGNSAARGPAARPSRDRGR